MNQDILPASLQLGFLTVFQEGSGWIGGYLVTNSWGRPVEFRLSTAVNPNRIQQILYGHTLEEYLCGELIGKTLIEKTASPAHLIFTDTLHVLALRKKLDLPVLAMAPETDPQFSVAGEELVRMRIEQSSVPVVYAREFAGDEPRIREMLLKVDSGMDISEPFARIREAMGEARRMGVTSRG